MYVIVSNVGKTLAYSLRYFAFQDSGRPPSWILSLEILLAIGVQRVDMHHNPKFCHITPLW